MITYEVNLNVNANIYDEFFLWLKDHIQEMLQFKGFQRASLSEELNLENASGIRKIIVNYDVDTLTNLQEYFDLHATTLRNISVKKFGDQVTATRRVLKLNLIIEK